MRNSVGAQKRYDWPAKTIAATVLRLCIPATIRCPRKYLNIKSCYNWRRWCALIRATGDDRKMRHLCCIEEIESENPNYVQTGKIIKTFKSLGYVMPVWVTVPVRTADIWHFKTAQQKQLEPLRPFCESQIQWQRVQLDRPRDMVFFLLRADLRSSFAWCARPTRTWPVLVAGSGCSCMCNLTPLYQSKLLSRH